MLDIVVVNYRTPEMTADCLRSLSEHTSVDHHITVVDNGSRDGSVEYLHETFPQAQVIASPENRGYAAACNLGARAGQGDHLIFLNSDIVALPGWDVPLIGCLESDERIAVVGPKLVDRYGHLMGAGVIGTNAQPIIRGWYEPDLGQYDQQTDCVSVCGAAYLIKRRLIPILGLFDERYFFYFEETDYSFNARQKGYRIVYCPAAKMIHHHAQTSRLVAPHGHFRAGERLFAQKWAHLMQDRTRYG